MRNHDDFNCFVRRTLQEGSKFRSMFYIIANRDFPDHELQELFKDFVYDLMDVLEACYDPNCFYAKPEFMRPYKRGSRSTYHKLEK